MRLPTPDIRSLMRSGRRISHGPLQLVVASSGAPASRFACIVSTAIDKRATRRNRMKRLIRESVRKLSGTPVDAVIVVKKKLPDTQWEVDKLVHEIFQKNI